MPAERVAMRDVRVIIRLKYLSSLTTSEIARRLGLARSTVRETLSRFEGIVTLPCEVDRRSTSHGLFKPPRRPRATCSSPRRVARGEIELR
jgi:DNA-binding transcriptional ArsR family regulator